MDITRVTEDEIVLRVVLPSEELLQKAPQGATRPRRGQTHGSLVSNASDDQSMPVKPLWGRTQAFFTASAYIAPEYESAQPTGKDH